MDQITLSVPVNGLSFGNVSIAIMREMKSRGMFPHIFPVSDQVDLSTQKPDNDFNQWLSTCVNSANAKFSHKNRAIRLWHIRGSEIRHCDKGNDLLTFHELDSLHGAEINILRQHNKVYVTSKFSQSVFAQFGIKSEYVPLGFDHHNFHQLDKRPTIDGVTSFWCGGKLEYRKGHMQMLTAWAKRYGNRKEYRLNLSLHNPFMRPEDQNALIARALDGKHYWNINFLPFAATNAEYNTVLQSSEIVISMSRGEGFNLPLLHATAMGAWPVALGAHAHLDYLNNENAVLVNPNGKEPANDNVFFAQNPNNHFNVGNWFTWDTEEFYKGCEEAEKRAKTGVNTKGLELQKWTYKETVDALLQ